MKIKGIITSLVTPMKKNKKIDFQSLKKILNYQKKNNIKNIVVSGTTGESSTIKLKESIKIIKFIKKKYKKSFNIIFCCCTNSTSKSISINKIIDKLKIKAILQTVPYYTLPTQKGIIKHFSKIESKIKTPIIIYNIPKRCGIKMEIKTIKKIYKKKGIIGIKNSVEDIEYCLETIKKFNNKNFRVYCGDDTKFHLFTILGCYGNISVASNAIPKKMNNIYNKLKKKPLEAYKKYERIMKLIKIMFIEINPIPIKYILNKMGLIKNFLRLPLTKIQKKNKIKVNKIIKKKGLLKINGNKNIKK